ncbi:hypothetical protein HMPREF9718_03791 [Sphingobium yanoikuyae ATCC 51230]|uniref:Uncharacterized protein n=1 Tax=Sphingobium yanoikuyae ATCC 51230 TaxID=883163 RepID=K9D2X2_SPHYA|nr:hypothetical protein HMPREF9718_03791 [Sphingobium yanoikuyae ATCC 51230]
MIFSKARNPARWPGSVRMIDRMGSRSVAQFSCRYIGNPGGSFLEVRILIIDECSDLDRGRAAKLTKTLDGGKQDWCEFLRFGGAEVRNHHTIYSRLERGR